MRHERLFCGLRKGHKNYKTLNHFLHNCLSQIVPTHKLLHCLMLQIRWFIFFQFFLCWLISFFGKRQATKNNRLSPHPSLGHTPILGVPSPVLPLHWKLNNNVGRGGEVRGHIIRWVWIPLLFFFVPFSVLFAFINYESYLNVPFGSILTITLLKFSGDIWPHYSPRPPPDRVSLSMCQHQALSGGNVEKVHSFFHHLQCLLGACHSKCPLNWNELNTSHYSES